MYSLSLCDTALRCNAAMWSDENMSRFYFEIIAASLPGRDAEMAQPIFEYMKMSLEYISIFRHSRAGTLCTSYSDVGWVEQSETHHRRLQWRRIGGFRFALPTLRILSSKFDPKIVNNYKSFKCF
jgi:hypothetical protein